MIGKVIEGRYKGASVNKLPDRNVLFIQTEDGTKVALSKSNAISIDDVTDQYPSYGRKVMMVMWNDFETSIIQLGVPPRKVPTNQETTAPHCSTKKEVNYKAKKSKQHKISLPWVIGGICLLIVLVLAFLLISSNAKSEKNNETTSSMVNSLEEITAPDNSAVTSNDTAEKELVIGEWILLNIDGVTLNFRFDGFSPLQDHLDFGKHVYLLCAIENTSLHDYDTYSLFEYNITIKDAEGFSVPHSSSGWNYEGYDCFTDIGSGEKKKTVQAYDYNGDVSKLSITIDAGDCIYTYIDSDRELLSDVGKEAPSTISEASSTCSKAVGNELDHVRGEWETIQQPTSTFPGIRILCCSVCGEEIDRVTWFESDRVKEAIESQRSFIKLHSLNRMGDYLVIGVEYTDIQFSITNMKKVSDSKYVVNGIETLIDKYGEETKRKFECEVLSDDGGLTWDVKNLKHPLR